MIDKGYRMTIDKGYLMMIDKLLDCKNVTGGPGSDGNGGDFHCLA